MDIPKRLKELRECRGISVYKLSKISEISSTYLHELERGEKQPTVEKVYQICTALGITLSEFFTDDQEAKPLPPEVKQICDKVKQLPLDKLKILNAVLDTWKEE